MQIKQLLLKAWEITWVLGVMTLFLLILVTGWVVVDLFFGWIMHLLG
jgi:hypothetical protein